jgi:transcription-repair coupling factor (superfamily II helicase)
VGFDMYLRLVGEAVSEFRGDEDTAPTEMKIELPVNAHLPGDLEQQPSRLRKLAEAVLQLGLNLADAVHIGGLGQGAVIRFAPADLPESKQMRLQRMHPGSKIVPVPGADASGARQVLIPKPKTARVGGKDLTAQ